MFIDRRRRCSPPPPPPPRSRRPTDALIVARALQGLGAAFVTPLSLTLLSDAVPGGPARPGDRRLVRRRRPRRRARPGRRRRDRRRALVALDLLGQRADRARADPARPARARREPRPEQRAGPARPRARRRRPAGARPTGSCAPTRSAGRSPVVLGAIAGGPRAARRCSCCWEGRAPEPMLPLRFFRNRTFSATNVVSFAMFFGVFGSIFFLSQFFQTVQGLLAAGVGHPDPAVDGDADLRRADRRHPQRPDRRAAADGDRPRAAGVRDRVARRRSPRSASRTRRCSRRSSLGGAGHGARLRAVGQRGASARSGPSEVGQASGATNTIRELGGVLGVAVLATRLLERRRLRLAAGLRGRHDRRAAGRRGRARRRRARRAARAGHRAPGARAARRRARRPREAHAAA